jgi:hypothetical protein
MVAVTRRRRVARHHQWEDPMSDVVTGPAVPAISLTPSTGPATVAELLGLVITGQPFPPELQRPSAMPRPASVEEGLGRIVRGAT